MKLLVSERERSSQVVDFLHACPCVSASLCEPHFQRNGTGDVQLVVQPQATDLRRSSPSPRWTDALVSTSNTSLISTSSESAWPSSKQAEDIVAFPS